ncbi:MAG: hypothetical protein ROO71_08955 [Balneola sp.]
MDNTRTALINHVSSASASEEVTAKAVTVEKYAGQIKELADKKTRVRIKLPAILIMFGQGNPLDTRPVHGFSLFFITETDKLDKKESEADALAMAQDYAKWLLNNHEFEDATSYYTLVNLEQSQVTLLLNDHKYTILELPVNVAVNRGD